MPLGSLSITLASSVTVLKHEHEFNDSLKYLARADHCPDATQRQVACRDPRLQSATATAPT